MLTDMMEAILLNSPIIKSDTGRKKSYTSSLQESFNYLMAGIQENHSLPIIGRLVRVDIPEWDLFELQAKIDTGAYTSSLHCHHIEHQTTPGEAMVRFSLLDPSHDAYNDKLFEWPVFKTKKVKSSNGQSEERIIVKTNVVIANRTILGELSLTDRSEMRYPLLIGRKLLKNKFLVDVSRKFD